MSASSEDMLEVFLFVLLRDHVPFGTVEDILRNHIEPTANEGQAVFESATTLGLARRYAERIQSANNYAKFVREHGG